MVSGGLAAAATLAATACAASLPPPSPPSCPPGLESHGRTSDGAWLACEVPLAANQYGQLTPSGRLELHATNGNGTVHTFSKTSEAMFGCNGKHFNATAGCGDGWGPNAGRGGGGAGTGADPVAAEVMDQSPAMVYDGGPDMYDPAAGGRGAKVGANSGWNAHTFVGSRSAAVDAVFDSYAGDVNSVGFPGMNPFLGKYQRSKATFKDKMNRLEQREGLWGGYLPIVSFHFKIAEGAPTPGKCSDMPRPCPAHPGRTYCPNVHKDRQCDSSPAPCPPCPHPPPAPPPTPPSQPCTAPNCTRCKPVAPGRDHFHPCQHHPNRCCGVGEDGMDNFIALPDSGISEPPFTTEAVAAVSDPYHDAEFSTDAGGGWVEWTAVPVPDMKGNFVQDVMFRVIKLTATGTVVEARYFDTYAYRSMDGVSGDAPVPGMGHPPGSAVASKFYQTLLDQKLFWESTFAHEGTIRWKLPNTTEATSRAPRSQPKPIATTTTGASLAHRVWHSIVRDMIIRAKTYTAKYGVLPNVYGGAGNFNCDLTTTQSLRLGLYTGSFAWARGVLENFFKFDQRADGPRYRGPSMPSNAQHISLFSLYYFFTKDPTNILGRYHNDVLALVNQMRAVRAKALRLSPTNPAYGMPTGNTVDDLFGTSIECGTTFPDGKAGPGGDCETRLPSFDIAFKMIQAFRDLGDAWVAMGRQTRPGLPANLTAEGELLIAEAAALRNDTLTAFRRGVVHTENRTWDGRLVPCHPCHAGWISCNPHADVTGKHYSRPSADVMCGAMQVSSQAYAALSAAAFADVFDYQAQGQGRGFHEPLWYSLTADHPAAAITTFYVTASRIMTRGTWTGAIGGSGSQPGTGVSTVTSSSWATGLTHLFVFDQAERDRYPFYRTLWLGKAIPRAWLAPGETIGIEGAPTRYGGRVSLTITAAVADHYSINVSLPTQFTWPEGGLKVRLRAPAFVAGRRISGVTVSGKPYPNFNGTEETLSFPPHAVAPSSLQNISIVLS